LEAWQSSSKIKSLRYAVSLCNKGYYPISIRPTDFSTANGSEIEITTDIAKSLGNKHYIYGRRGKIALSVSLREGLLLCAGELFTFMIDPAKIYLFDAKNKKTLQ